MRLLRGKETDLEALSSPVDVPVGLIIPRLPVLVVGQEGHILCHLGEIHQLGRG